MGSMAAGRQPLRGWDCWDLFDASAAKPPPPWSSEAHGAMAPCPRLGSKSFLMGQTDLRALTPHLFVEIFVFSKEQLQNASKCMLQILGAAASALRSILIRWATTPSPPLKPPFWVPLPSWQGGPSRRHDITFSGERKYQLVECWYMLMHSTRKPTKHPQPTSTTGLYFFVIYVRWWLSWHIGHRRSDTISLPSACGCQDASADPTGK